MTPQEKLFVRIAFNKKYIDEAAIQQAILWQNQYSQRGLSVSIPQVLLKSKLLSPEQMQDIQAEYKFRTSTIPPLSTMENKPSVNKPATIGSNEPVSAIGSSDPVSAIGSSDPVSAIGSSDPVSAIDSNQHPTNPPLESDIYQRPQTVTKPFSSGDKIFNHYTIGKELGRGGMGVVYKAYDTKLKRTVALKLLLAKQVTALQQERFTREAEAMAQLNHPNIIKIHEIGHSPQSFFTMEYIPGKTFLEHIVQGSMDLQKRLCVIRDAALAIHHIHKKGYVHRDIKPANIMIDENKEPKVMDFGLVKFDDSNLSQESDVLGTPVFMPPEQLGAGEVDRRSDVYSLGATLYQALTGRPPFQGDTTFNIMFQVTTKEPIPLRQLNPDIPIQLESISLKCLEKKKHYRYNTAKELASDIDNYLNGKAIIARPPTRMELARKWMSQNKIKTSVFMVILTLLFASGYYWRIAEKNAQAAKENAQIAQENAQIAEKNEQIADDRAKQVIKSMNEVKKSMKKFHESSYYLAVTLSNEYLKQNNIAGIDTYLSQFKTKDTAPYKNWEWSWIVNAVENSQSPIILENAANRFCTFSSGIYQDYVAISGSEYINLFNIRTRKSHFLDVNQKEKIKHCHFNSDGSLLVYCSEQEEYGLVRLWSVKDKKLLRTFPHQNEVNCSRFSHDSRFIVSGDHGHFVKIWNTHTGKLVNRIRLKQRIMYCFFIENDNKVLCLERSGIATIWDFKKNKRITKDIKALYAPSHDVGYLEGRQIFATCTEQKVDVWDVHDLLNKKPRAIFTQIASREFLDVKIHKDKIFIVDNNVIKKFDIRSGKLEKELRNGRNFARIAPHENGQYLISSQFDTTVSLWSLHKERPVPIKKNDQVCFAKFSEDSNKLIVGNKTCELETYNISTDFLNFEQQITRQANTYSCPGLGGLCDGQISKKYIVIAVKKLVEPITKSLVNIYDRKSGNIVYQIEKPASLKTETKDLEVINCSLSPINEDELAFASNEYFFIWDILQKKAIFHQTIRKLLTFKYSADRNPETLHFTYRPDGKQIAIVGEFREVIFVNPQKQVREYSLEVEEDIRNKPRITHCAYSPDGKLFALCSNKKTIMIYFLNPKTQRFEKENRIVIQGHYHEVLCCAFSPDGKRLISGSKDKQLLLWNTHFNYDEPGKPRKAPHHYLPLLTLHAHNKPIISCEFDNNGRRILSADEDTVYLWDIEQKNTTDH